MVTKEDVEKAEAEWVAASKLKDSSIEADRAAIDSWFKYHKLKEEYKKVTKKEVDEAKAKASAAAAIADAAVAVANKEWDKYTKLKEEYENGN